MLHRFWRGGQPMVTSFNTVRRIVSGFGSIDALPEEIKRLRGNKVLVVTDPGIRAAGLLDHMIETLDRASLGYRIFSDVEWHSGS